MDDVIFLIFFMYKQLVYLHLVGWMSQIWYIPTWLGDECMYESLVIGRSLVMYVEIHVIILENIFADFACAQGEHGLNHESSINTFQHIIEFRMYSGGA